MPEGPARRLLLDTADVDQAREVVGAGYCDHRLEVHPRSRPFRAVQSEVRTDRVAVHRLRYGADVRIDATPLDRYVLVTTPLRGSLTLSYGSRSVRVGPGEPLAIGPDRDFRLLWEGDCELLTVRLSRDAVVAAGHVEGGEAGPALSLDPTPRDLAAARRTWRGLVDFVEAQCLAGSDVVRSPVLSATLEQLLAGAAVRAHRPAASAPAMSVRGAGSRAVRRGVAFLEGNAHRPVTLEEVATAAGVGVRALQEGFRRELGRTPTEVLRELRLQRARETLLRADGPDVTVADVAHAAGFAHLGRFAQAYRERFGELPSQALRR